MEKVPSQEIPQEPKLKKVICDYESETCYIPGMGNLNQSGGGMISYGESDNFLVPVKKRRIPSKKRKTIKKRKPLKKKARKRKKVSSSRKLQFGGSKRKRRTKPVKRLIQIGGSRRRKQKFKTRK